MMNGGSDAEFLEREAFKDMMRLEADKKEQEEAKVARVVQRKPANPKPMTKDFNKSELETILEQMQKDPSWQPDG